ncbi:hypothetical protein OC846_001368 [Tilletia horrida]|uniref:2,5-diamino-6-ribosylamino-4(3H)-pyrimidinone 5'-phosphate reductase n=1 Tax=Tilletia horrida TaxID=155126 RepID=A0AAN6GU32_9BASI|nr:hypothetical protein OC845_005824 [Tilletia horrida]KAK0556149.1 hypothetical protein OC846_001368 [Tilletia horrida]KAK0569075.1 hypothetical protein OC861_001317 [Tilletia horrida]
MMFQQDPNQLLPQHSDSSNNSLQVSSALGDSSNPGSTGSQTPSNPTIDGGLSRANSLARTRAIATLKRAASARELKRAASQNRHDASPSPLPSVLPGPEQGNARATEPGISAAAPAPAPAPEPVETIDPGYLAPPSAASAAAVAFSAPHLANDLLSPPLAVPQPTFPPNGVLPDSASAISHHSGSEGGFAHPYTHAGPVIPAPFLLPIPIPLPISAAGGGLTPPLARTPPQPGPTMVSQVARTYAMAKLLGAAGLQAEAEEEQQQLQQQQQQQIQQLQQLQLQQLQQQQLQQQQQQQLQQQLQQQQQQQQQQLQLQQQHIQLQQQQEQQEEINSTLLQAAQPEPSHSHRPLSDGIQHLLVLEPQPEAEADPTQAAAVDADQEEQEELRHEDDELEQEEEEEEEEVHQPEAVIAHPSSPPRPIGAVIPDVPTTPEGAHVQPSPEVVNEGSVFEALTSESEADFVPPEPEAEPESAPPADADVSFAPSAVAAHTSLIESSASGPISVQPEADEPLTQVDSIDTPGLLLSATVNQIKSANDFEEKFLLLFSDTLVIAKPLAPPEGMEGEPRLRAESFMEKPDLDWSFSVERVVHLHRVGLIVHRDRTIAPSPHALMPSFVRHFATNPDGAIAQLMTLTGLSRDPKTIAKLLYQTPELDAQQLTNYICMSGKQEVMDAFISMHAVTGVSIESSLRSFLLGIRFPNDRAPFKNLLIAFSKHWVASNRALIKPAFSSGLAANLIFYIMALNDALHVTDPARQMFSGPRPNYSESDFLQEFRKLDGFGILSDRTLSHIYHSVRAERIQSALAPREGPRLSVRVVKGLPAKLSPHIASEPITVLIDRPDPEFAVRLYGKDFEFTPSVLNFAHTNRITFTITPRTLDAKTITFVKVGRRAPHYVAVPSEAQSISDVDGGESVIPLPRSFSVVIEPPELRHTFTLTIAQGDMVKHRLTFSAEDAHRKRVITNALKERIDICISKKRAQSREEAAASAAAAAAASVAPSFAAGFSSHRAQKSSVSSSSVVGTVGSSRLERREPSPIPPLNPSGAETFAFCEVVAESFLRRVYNHCMPFVSPASAAGSSAASSPMVTGEGLVKPHVTLTFAQSLDAKIAGMGGKQLILSGEQSMLMTHSLRTLHDGILVGAGTAVNDNPQLNARLLPRPPGVNRLPRPIVLDTNLRTPTNCKLLLNYRNGTGRQPLLICARTASGIRAAELEKAGAELAVASCEFDGLLSWRVVLAILARKGITRLMVEGGASVISGLLDSHFVDTLIVTVAPKLIGPQGISHNATLPLAGPSATSARGASDDFNLVTSRQFGRDVVFAWQRKESSVSERQSRYEMTNGQGMSEARDLSVGGHADGPTPATFMQSPVVPVPPKTAPTTTGGFPSTHVKQPLSPTHATHTGAGPSSGSGTPLRASPVPTPASAPPTATSFLGRLASLRRGNSKRGLSSKNNQDAVSPPTTAAGPARVTSGHEHGSDKMLPEIPGENSGNGIHHKIPPQHRKLPPQYYDEPSQSSQSQQQQQQPSGSHHHHQNHHHHENRQHQHQRAF